MRIQNQFPEHLYSLDLARGIAALCVVISHFSHFYFVGGHFFIKDRSLYPLYEFLVPFYLLASEAVGFFFLLSGFIFFWLYRESVGNRQCGFREFAIARFSRLYPLHLITLLIMALLQAFYANLHGVGWVFSENSVWAFLKHLFMLSHWGDPVSAFNAPSATVSIELGLYLIFFILAYARVARWQYVLPIAAMTLFLAADGFRTTWLFALCCFFIGGLTYLLTKTYILSRYRSLGTDVFIVILAILPWTQAYDVDFVNQILRNRWLSVPGILPLTLFALVLLDTHFNEVFKKIRLLGDLSYSIYMVHFPIQLAMVLFITKLGVGPGFFLKDYSLPVYLSLVLGVGYLSYRYLERPAQSKIRSWARQNRTSLKKPSLG